MANQVQLLGNFRVEEALGSGTLYPGMLVETTSAGAFQAHSTEGGFAERSFVVEDALQGKTVDDSYASGARVFAHFVEPGAEVNAMIENGQNVSIGEALISAGNGKLITLTAKDSATDVKQIVAYATEAIDLTVSGSADTLSAVRVA